MQAGESTSFTTPTRRQIPSVYVLSRADARRLDELAVNQYAMPSIMLMENAARSVAKQALSMLPQFRTPSGGPVPQAEPEQQIALILCGPGNNGGDGLAAARHLSNAGLHVALLRAAPPERFKGDAAINCLIVEKMGLPMFGARADNPAQAFDDALAACGGTPHLIIDALLGTGLNGPVTGPTAALIERANALRSPRSLLLAIDIPSGLDADTGRPAPGSPAIRADFTVTMAGLKKGFLDPAARVYTGRVVVADLGVPTRLLDGLAERSPFPAYLA
jgi:NAD(P)H-hydrate epimerase